MQVMYETITGSVSYGCSTGDSDFDIVGFTIPPKHIVFPHLAGEIFGFGRQIKRFNQYQRHHVFDPDALGGKGREYDFAIYSIVKFFQLCMENNPNMVDALFTPERCVLTSTTVSQMVREKRKMFLHKGCYHKFRGYANSQLKKAQSINRVGKRKAIVEEFGYDVRFAYHIVRLMDEVEQILETGDLDLERSREVLKAIRRGDWTLEQVKDHFYRHEKYAEELYHSSSLPYTPREDEIKQLLIDCLEHHYGSLGQAELVIPGRTEAALREIHEITERILG
jgi:predicted nucleotidyltransferase